MARDMETAVIYQVAFSWEDKPVFVPVMETDDRSKELALEWAASLVRWSGRSVEVYRNGIRLITLRSPQ